MQLTFDIEDNLAQQFFETVPKNKQKSVVQTLLSQYLSQKTIKNNVEESPLEFVGMWKDKNIDPLDYAKELRKGRNFNVN